MRNGAGRGVRVVGDQLALGGEVWPPGHGEGVWLRFSSGVWAKNLGLLLLVWFLVGREGQHPFPLVAVLAAVVGMVLLGVGVVTVLMVGVIIVWWEWLHVTHMRLRLGLLRVSVRVHLWVWLRMVFG